MPFKPTFIFSIILLLLISSCNRKQAPQSANAGTSTTKPDTTAAKKMMIKRMAIPKMIAVNDKAAKKSVDGRLYYDLDGHRYWKNYIDGKYYLFNQSMYSDKAFKPHTNR